MKGIVVSVDELLQPIVGSDLSSFAALRGAERDAAFLGVTTLIRGLSVLQGEMIRTVATAGSFGDDAHHSAKAWVEAVLNASPATASRLVKTAALFADVPELANAVRAGSVGLDQVEELRKLHGNHRCRAELQQHGYRLVGPAKNLTFGDFRQVLARWRAHVDPDGTHRDHEASRQRRHVRSGVSDHVGIIHAEGDAASVDEMVDILKAHVESEFSKDCQERKVRYGDDADEHPLRRTHGQRCFDAMQEIFRKAARTAVPGINEPTVNIFTTETAFAAAVGNYFGHGQRTRAGTRAPDPATEPFSPNVSPDLGPDPMAEWEPYGQHGFCENEHGSPIDPADMVVAALLGRVRSVIVTNDGRYLHAGSRTRLFTGKTRDTLLLLGRHRCSRQGCGLSGPCIQVDHLESHACGGCTTALNGGPLWPLHNRTKYDLNFTVTHDQYGWHHYRPDGTEIAPRGT